MNGNGSNDAPDADKDASWANETLPLGMRRVLLNRDLEKALGRRHQHGQPGPRQEGESSTGSDGHPNAEG
jgi:hypothetical protein